MAEGAIDIAKTLFFIFIFIWFVLLMTGLFIFKK
ncbi:MAG TPA: hypothetical protein VK806_00400 [Bacteroidia bacterium]|nr:hypothetical protein [Bacteroidia bacterium]